MTQELRRALVASPPKRPVRRRAGCVRPMTSWTERLGDDRGAGDGFMLQTLRAMLERRKLLPIWAA